MGKADMGVKRGTGRFLTRFELGTVGEIWRECGGLKLECGQEGSCGDPLHGSCDPSFRNITSRLSPETPFIPRARRLS
jgi:hypothetical protein